MNYESVRTLGQVLGCYFHQDWPDEFDSDHAALQEILKAESIERLKICAEEIEEILNAHLSESDLRELLINEVGCYFEPASNGMTYKQWLVVVQEKFRRAH